jgi:hypothetical protein
VAALTQDDHDLVVQVEVVGEHDAGGLGHANTGVYEQPAELVVGQDGRHWTLVACAFSFCWHAGHAQAAQAGGPAPPRATPPPAQAAARGPSNISIQTAATGPAGVGVSWPQALRRVRAWLAPWVWLQRCWRGWSTSPPPPGLQQALEWVRAGQPIYLYLPP